MINFHEWLNKKVNEIAINQGKSIFSGGGEGASDDWTPWKHYDNMTKKYGEPEYKDDNSGTPHWNVPSEAPTLSVRTRKLLNREGILKPEQLANYNYTDFVVALDSSDMESLKRFMKFHKIKFKDE